MDIFAHGLYAGALGKTVGGTKKERKKIIGLSVLFGMLPDLIAFGPSFLVGIFGVSTGHHGLVGSINLSQILYPYTHSLVIAVGVLILVWVIRRQWWIPLFGWILHILIDIPLHTPDFFPTPFLFPASSWTSPVGISWGNTYVLVGTWIIIISYYLWLFLRNRKSL